MARKQADYLSALLSDDADEKEDAPSPAPIAERAPERVRGTTLLGRESALARVASGEVRQVTQLLLDPARVRIWPGNARAYAHLSEENCRELIDSIVAEGGQKVPAVVRRVEGDTLHDYEVIAGTRRHWSISWLRSHSYPDMRFVAQVADLDDEAAFRLADLENRARKDVSDLERARNYATALIDHAVIAAFASPDDVQLKPAYTLAQALDDKGVAKSITAVAKQVAKEQAARHEEGQSPYPAADVLRRLLDAPALLQGEEKPEPYRYATRHGRTALSVQSANRQGVTIRLHAGSGANTDELVAALREALAHLEATGKGLQR